MHSQARPATLSRQGTTRHVSASSAEPFSPGGVELRSSVSFQQAFPSAATAISRRSQSAARHVWLRCGSVSPEQQENGIQDSLGSAGSRSNMIPGKPTSANSKAKKWNYLITPVLGRARCISHVISISWFYQLQFFCLQTLKSEQRKAYSYEKKSKCINYFKIHFIAKLYL